MMVAALARMPTSPRFPGETADSALEVIRRHQSAAPVDVGALARDLGINVYQDDLGRHVSGVLRRDEEIGGDSGYAIIVNSAHPPARKRFTVAHEIAHFVLHRGKAASGIEDDEFYRCLSNELEREANRYAAEILMPWPLVNRLQDDGKTELGTLSKALGVSKQALAIRLGLPYDQDWS
jgi:predicted transcriptional regulator